MNFDDLLCDSIGLAIDNQSRLNDLLGKYDWNLKMHDGIITFTLADGSLIEAPAQLVGTKSYHSETWRWGWANEEEGIAEKYKAAIERLRTIGEREQIEALTTPQLALDGSISGLNEWDYTMLAAGFLDGPVHRCPHEDGEVFVLVDKSILPAEESISATCFAERFEKCTRIACILQQDRALHAYASLHCFGIEFRKDRFRITDRRGQKVDLLFNNAIYRSYKEA
ncbi:MAG: hypothetical protein SFY80_02295 [Verrucomicrobiota bacterium]|nr:hypothetical protein [Verrucomicrobiota bacterium]